MDAALKNRIEKRAYEAFSCIAEPSRAIILTTG